MTIFTVSPNLKPVYQVKVDWNNNNFADSYCDISQYVKSVSTTRGHAHELSLTADPGSCKIILKNDSQLFSHFNSGSSLYNKMIPGLLVDVNVTAPSGAFQTAGVNGTPTAMFNATSTYNHWTGYTVDFTSHGGTTNTLDAELDCEDALGFLNNCLITVPLLTNIDAVTLLNAIVDAAWLQPSNSYGVLFSGTNPVNGDWFQLLLTGPNGVVIEQRVYVYTTGTPVNIFWSSAVPVAGEIKIGGTIQATLASTICALLGSDRFVSLSGSTIYSNGQNGGLPPTSFGPGIDYSANCPISNYYTSGPYSWDKTQSLGTDPNNSSANMTYGNFYLPFNSRLFGGVTLSFVHAAQSTDWLTVYAGSRFLRSPNNPPASLHALRADNVSVFTNISTTTRTNFSYVNDTNTVKNQTNALDLARSVADSEFGRLFVNNTGQIVFATMTDLETSYNSPGHINLAPTPYIGFPSIMPLSTSPLISVNTKRDKKINEAAVTYVPRSLKGTTGSPIVLGNYPNSITVPGQSGTDRWNGVVTIPGGGNTMVTINYTDPDTGQPFGAAQLLPLIAGTDWNASDNPQADGVTIPYNYNGTSSLTFSVVNNGSHAQVSIKNTALGPLYVFGLQVRGVGIVNYQSNTIYIQSSTYALSKQKFSHQHQMNLPVDPLFANGVANWLVTKYSADLPNIYDKLVHSHQNYLGDIINFPIIPWWIDLYQAVSLIDSQTGLTTGQTFQIIGLQSDWGQDGIPSFQFQLERLDQYKFFTLDVSSLDGPDILGA